MLKLKSSITGKLIDAFNADKKRIDALELSKTILVTLTETILEASP